MWEFDWQAEVRADRDPVVCPGCGDTVKPDEDTTITPEGIYHEDHAPDVEEFREDE